MSILTISQEEMVQRKINSDLKNDTEELTFENSKRPSSHGEAARKVRDRNDVMNISKICTATDVSEYQEMLKEF